MTPTRAVNLGEYHMRPLRYLAWHPIAGGNGESDPPTDPPATPPTSGGPKDGDPEKRFTQADLDAHIAARLERERKKAEDAAKKAADDAEAKRLTDQQEFKALADRHEARVKELEPQAQQAERYEAALRKHLESQRRDLPAHITELLDQLDVAAQLEWIAAHRDELVKANGHAAVPATPRPAGAPNREDAVQQALKELNATRSREF